MMGVHNSRRAWGLGFGFLLMATAACGGDDEGTTAPGERGNFSVLTSSTGPELDADGYEILVNDIFAALIGPNDSVQFGNRAADTYTVQLADVAGNCTVAGENPRSVTVSSGAEAVTTFDVTCTETAGVLQVVTETTGPDPDDAYTLFVDGDFAGPIGANDTISSAELVTGNHSVRIGDIALNCQIVGNPGREVSVPSQDTVRTTYEVLCTDRVGYVRLITSTTGTLPDEDGYEAVIEFGTPIALPTTGVRTVGSVAAGVTTVRLVESSVADNCSIEGPNPRTVTVPSGGLVESTFVVSCTLP